MKNIRFFTGGPAFHPTTDQAKMIAGWLGPDYQCEIVEGAPAFDDLDAVDLLAVMGLHWPGMSNDWAGSLTYEPLDDARKQSLRDYVGSGRPVLGFHGGVASYPDWPEFGNLLGFYFRWKLSNHDVGNRLVAVEPTDDKHPLNEGIEPFVVRDEVYVNVQAAYDMPIDVHAQTRMEGARFPMILSGEGGRLPGAGKAVYLANGHDLRAFEAPAIRRIWENAIRWLLES